MYSIPSRHFCTTVVQQYCSKLLRLAQVTYYAVGSRCFSSASPYRSPDIKILQGPQILGGFTFLSIILKYIVSVLCRMLVGIRSVYEYVRTYVLWRNTPVCWVCNRRVSRDMQAFMLWLILGVLACWWGYAWKGHSDNWALKNLSIGIEASATGESLNRGDPAVHPAARHNPLHTIFPQKTFIISWMLSFVRGL